MHDILTAGSDYSQANPFANYNCELAGKAQLRPEASLHRQRAISFFWTFSRIVPAAICSIKDKNVVMTCEPPGMVPRAFVKCEVSSQARLADFVEGLEEAALLAEGRSFSKHGTKPVPVP